MPGVVHTCRNRIGRLANRWLELPLLYKLTGIARRSNKENLQRGCIMFMDTAAMRGESLDAAISWIGCELQCM